jgi:ureidoglycolate hydrolase
MLNDYDRRWRRAIFDFPDRMAFQRTDDSFARYGVVIDAQQHTLQLTRGGSQTWRALFDYERASENELRMEGTMDGHAIRMRLSLVGLDTFPLLNSSFRWIRPPD